MALTPPDRLTARVRRPFLVIIGLLLTAQITAVATAGTTGARLDQPTSAPALAAAASGTTVTTGKPLVSVDLDPFEVEVGIGPIGPQGTVDAAGMGCGASDRPETGLQGDVPLPDQLSGRASEGYNCGLDVVGYHSLGDRGGNSNLAWAGDCAFVAGDGIAVLDVSDPARPRHTTTLRTPGSSQTLETLAAGKVGDRALLAAGRYGLFVDFSLSGSAPVDIFDVSDCSNPRQLSTIQIAPGVHNLTFSPDLETLWSSLPTQAIDVSDPAAPKLIANVDDQLRALGLNRLEISHEASISPDGTRLYLGGQVPGDEGTTIVDIEDFPTRPLRIVSNFGGPGHSLSHATIDGRPYLVRSDESVLPPTGTPCLPDLTPVGGVAQAFLTDLGDETAPVDRGTLSLEIDSPTNCVASLLSGVNGSAHYQNVDDPTDTTFAMVSMWNSGLRLFDIRDPDRPREVAYFNPGQFPLAPGFAGSSIDRAFGVLTARGSLDITWGHVRYDDRTGLIWAATRTGGFWVLQLQPQVREVLGLPDVASRPVLEGSPRPLASREVRPPGLLPGSAPAGLYCTIAPLNAL